MRAQGRITRLYGRDGESPVGALADGGHPGHGCLETRHVNVVTVSFTGNDWFFGKIVSSCLMGYTNVKDSTAEKECETGLAGAASKLESTDEIAGLRIDTRDLNIKKAGLKSLLIYWTGHPQLFDVTTNKCHSAFLSALHCTQADT